MNKYSHKCPDFDGLKINVNDLEFANCTCFKDDPVAQSVKNIIADEYNFYIDEQGSGIDA